MGGINASSLMSHEGEEEFSIVGYTPLRTSSKVKNYPKLLSKLFLLGLVPLNPVVWCYVWHYIWLNVVINKVVLLLSKIMVTWIFGHYHIVYEMHSMWFMWFSHRKYKSQVLCKLRILVHSRWWNWAFHLRIL